MSTLIQIIERAEANAVARREREAEALRESALALLYSGMIDAETVLRASPCTPCEPCRELGLVQRATERVHGKALCTYHANRL